MAKTAKPVTVFTATAEQAQLLASANDDSRAITTGTGTLKFHLHIAEHGAGLFTTLYVPLALKGKFMLPAGGEVEHIN